MLERILGVEPKLVMYSDSISSRQLIAPKGLGKVRHLDVDLLWIQRINCLVIKAIKGKDNPADLGTKSLRTSERKGRFDEAKVSRIIQAASTAILISLGEAKKKRKAKNRCRVEALHCCAC